MTPHLRLVRPDNENRSVSRRGPRPAVLAAPFGPGETKEAAISGGLCTVSKSVLLIPIAVHHGSAIIAIAERALS